MKRILLLVLVLLTAPPAIAEDMREAGRKARAAREAALTETREAEARILSDRSALTTEITRLEAEVEALEGDKERFETTANALESREEDLAREWSDREMAFRELVGTIRMAARDLEAALMNSPLTADDPDRLADLAPVLGKGHFPGMDDLAAMTGLYFDEIRRTGEVDLKEGTIVGRSGRDEQARILTIGPFTAAYATDEETGFLRYSEESRRLYALSSLPPFGVRRGLKRYIGGASDSVPIDLSDGGALRQITRGQGPIEHILSGGPIVWPILLIGLAAFAFVIERALYLKRVHGNADRLMGAVNDHASRGAWAACEAMVKSGLGKQPVCNVLAAGLSARDEGRETLESVLQEAILRELPRLERFLPTLGVLGAIAPLLGLLGTVTGMINTFHVITLYGTGDPRMMSGGISEALVTTELGLAIAIPIMLLHTILNRRVDHIVGEMEEKAVALTNIIHKGAVEAQSPAGR